MRSVLWVGIVSIYFLWSFALHTDFLPGKPFKKTGNPDAEVLPVQSLPVTTTIFLPLVLHPDNFGETIPIWAHTGPPAPHEVVLFRHMFTLEEPVSAAELSIFADTRYEVWVDGHWHGRGPARFSRKTREYDTYHLGSLGAGTHLVAVLVQWAPVARRSESTTPFLQARIQAQTPDGQVIVDQTDTRWKATLSDAWRQDAPPVHSWGLIGPTELLDLRRLPQNWMLSSFDDTAWQQAQTKDIPPATYQPRSILPLASLPLTPTVEEVGVWWTPFQRASHAGRRLLLAEPISDSQAVQHTASGLACIHTPSYMVLDLGRIVYGRFVAEVNGPAGTVVDIGWDERLWHNRRPLPYPGSLHPEWNQVDSWVLDGTLRTLSTLDARTGRYILVVVWNRDTRTPVTIQNLHILAERYPVEQRGRFQSTDPLLNRIWQVGVDTAFLNMTDAYNDPWRERGQWWGDAFVVDHVNQVASGNTNLLRRGLRFMAEAFQDGRPPSLAPNPDSSLLLDYGMLWVQSLSDEWRLSRDRATLERVYPVLVDFLRYLETYEHPTTHVLDIPEGEWYETALIDWAAYNGSRFGQSVPLNALYYDTLLKAAEMAEVMGNADQSRQWREKAAVVKAQVNALLYRPDEGRYSTSKVGEKTYPPSPQAQAWALAYNIVPEGEQQRVADALLALLSHNPHTPNVEIYGMYWVLEALGRTHRLGEAVDSITLYYGHMLEQGATTWWETFNAQANYANALSHGWGGSPTWFLTTYALGARRTGPESWQVSPGSPELGNISGSLPLQQGELQVSWVYTGTSEWRLDLVAPAGSEGQVLLPIAASPSPTMTLVLNGGVVWADGRARASNISVQSVQTDGLSLSLAGGRYVLACTH